MYLLKLPDCGDYAFFLCLSPTENFHHGTQRICWIYSLSAKSFKQWFKTYFTSFEGTFKKCNLLANCPSLVLIMINSTKIYFVNKMLNILVIYWVDKIPGGRIFNDNIMSWILLKLYIFSLPIQKKKDHLFIFKFKGQGIKHQELRQFSNPSILRGIKHYSTLYWLVQLFTNNPSFRYKNKLAFVFCLCCHQGITLKALQQHKNDAAVSYRNS